METGTPTSWPTELALAAATGLVTAAVPVHRWPTRAQWALHGATGALTGLAVVWLMRADKAPTTREADGDDETRDDRDDGTVPGLTTAPSGPGVTTTALTALGAAVAMAAVSAGGTLADRATEQALARRGVRHPRRWIGAAAAALALGTAVADRGTTANGSRADG